MLDAVNARGQRSRTAAARDPGSADPGPAPPAGQQEQASVFQWLRRRGDQLGANQGAANQVGAAQVGADQLRADQLRADQLRADQLAAGHGGPVQPGSDAAVPLFPVMPLVNVPRPVLPVIWLPDAKPPQVTLAEVGRERVTLCPAIDSMTGDLLWFTNHADLDPAAAGRLRDQVYAGRTARLAPIDLVRLPQGTAVCGGGNFVTICGNSFLAEQLPPHVHTDHAEIDALAPLDLPVVEVAREALLVGRYGMLTWGRWLCELLPKLVLAERAFPQRFAFLLPAELLRPSSEAIWPAICDSLAACGIGPERVLAASKVFSYRFAALHAVTPVWSDGMLHPGAAEALRDACAGIEASPRRRIALQRHMAASRTLANRDEINAMLRLRGFTLIEAGALPFAEQVAAFKGAEIVFAVLGSDLAGLVFAAPGVRVIAAAPETLADGFFQGLVAERQGRLADLRGWAVEARDPDRRSSFALGPQTLNAALDSLPQAPSD